MSGKLDDSGVVELTGKIMIVSIIVLFLVVVFVFFLHLYAKWFWYRRQLEADTPSRRRRRRLDFAGGHQEQSAVTVLSRGLEPSILKSIPISQFDPKDFKDGLECAVCLSELSEGEKTRILPKCNHGFHVECIDMWFHSHSTCPLCRNPVSDQSCTSTEISLEGLLDSPPQDYVTDESPRITGGSPNFPTNVLFWGNETQVSTLGSQLEEGNYQLPPASSEPASSSSASQTVNRANGMLVIDIPRQTNEDEDQKSPISSRMRSIKRLLSWDRKVNPWSPSGVDAEQGTTGQN